MTYNFHLNSIVKPSLEELNNCFISVQLFRWSLRWGEVRWSKVNLCLTPFFNTMRGALACVSKYARDYARPYTLDFGSIWTQPPFFNCMRAALACVSDYARDYARNYARPVRTNLGLPTGKRNHIQCKSNGICIALMLINCKSNAIYCKNNIICIAWC